MITSLLNAQRAGKKRVAIPYSRFKKALLDMLISKEMISHVRVQEGVQAKLIVTLAYNEAGEGRIRGVRRLSKPGRRVYVGSNEMPFAYNGIGFVIVSTPQGLLDESRARREKIGGELICAIW